jgi:hypothetical protein
MTMTVQPAAAYNASCCVPQNITFGRQKPAGVDALSIQDVLERTAGKANRNNMFGLEIGLVAILKWLGGFYIVKKLLDFFNLKMKQGEAPQEAQNNAQDSAPPEENA